MKYEIIQYAVLYVRFVYFWCRSCLCVVLSSRSGMLESGVDRIITQVVDPKMNHTFRPQIETAVHEFLSGDRKEESTSSSNLAPSEQTETQEPTCASGPQTPWGVSRSWL